MGAQVRADEASILGHLHCENEKLVSVIDAVGELSRRMHDPASVGVDGGDSTTAGVGFTGSTPNMAMPAPPSRSKRPRPFFATRMHESNEEKAYCSVLSGRPK